MPRKQAKIPSLEAQHLNATERRIAEGWVKEGMTWEDALARLTSDLDDAAEEDGYDGP